MSKTIHTPGIVKIDDHDADSATFTIEPLHTGYGMTIGNSLRRVLLSSIAGAAVTAFKIEGVTHEFTTLPYVKEDVVDIMLNLKNVDITVNAEVEIVNPDQIIATLDDTKAKFVMDITVETGRGYRTIEEGATRKNSDMVAVDAIFSPVLRVRYKVENTRVGQMTDLDKLIITVDTDGSITPRDAFEEASAILVNQYTALAGQTRVEVSAPLSASEELEITAEHGDEPPELMTPIEELNLSARTTNALVNNEIQTLKDLFSLSDVELRDLKRKWRSWSYRCK